MKKVILAFALAFVWACSVAQQVKVATGSPKGTYSTMLKELINVCGPALPMVEVNSTGSMDNISNLVGNQVNIAFTQTDVLFYRARTEDLGQVKTLLTFHPEEVHVIAPAVSTLKQGGTLGFGAKPVEFRTVEDLAGYRVGAAGGSFITAQVIRLQSEIKFEVVSFDTNDAVMAALASGEIQAGVFVGGQPLGVLTTLKNPNSVKLLSFSENTVGKLKGVYRPAKLNYAKMGQAGAGIATVATDAILVTREYKSAKMVTALSTFRNCALENLEDLKDTTGTHPKWQSVSADNKGKWAWYDLPGVVKTAKK